MDKKASVIISSSNQSKKKSGKLNGNRILVLLLSFILIISIGGSASVWILYRFYQTLPTLGQMQNIEQSLVSKMLGKDGTPVHEFSIERRFWVPIDKIPADLQNAVISIEDRRFYDHWGIDIRRIFGAAVVDLVRGGYAQGFSTITQQLARNVYLTQKKSIVRKLREVLTAVQLESCYTKKEIFELYLNQVYLGAGAYGVEAASLQYFSKHVWQLNTAECAVIGGLIQSPERYRPDKKENIKRITLRRNTVLSAMREMKVIDKKLAKELIAAPIITHPSKEKSNVGAYFVEMVRKYISDKYGDDLLYNGGLTIYTTIDRVAEDSAEQACGLQVKSLQERCNRIFLDSTHADRQLKVSRKFFMENFDSVYAANEDKYKGLPDSTKLRKAQIAVTALDVNTGAIRVMIGGRNFEESKFNRVLMARRQPGSSFKPFVYTAAMENGFNPASIVLDQPITLMTDQGEWRPENFDHVFNGPITIRNAIARSINLVAIQVLMKVGPEKVVEYARKMGLKYDLPAVPSLAIGACEVTPMELTSAYSIFPNHGIQATPYFIEKIVDKTGRVLERHTTNEKEVLSAQTSFLMCSLMRSVVCCGTAAAIPGLGFTRPAAGKTGTTNKYSDAWFVGYTPQIACGVWTGIDDRLSLGNGVTGSIAAVPVWVKTMIPLHRGLPVKDFNRPNGIKTMNICSESHLVAARACPKSAIEFFLEDTQLDTCDIHGPSRSKRDGNMIRYFGAPKTTEKSDAKKKKRPLMF